LASLYRVLTIASWLSTAGDHLGMLFRHGVEGAQAVRAFLRQI